MPHGRHMTKPYACCMDTIQKTYGFPYAFCMASVHLAYDTAICLLCSMHMASICLNHTGAIWIAYMRHIDLHMEITLCAISLPCGIHMASTWFSHVGPIKRPHGRHMTKPYACCMDTIQKAYGFAICLLYAFCMAVCHITSVIWTPYVTHINMTDV